MGVEIKILNDKGRYIDKVKLTIDYSNGYNTEEIVTEGIFYDSYSGEYLILAFKENDLYKSKKEKFFIGENYNTFSFILSSLDKNKILYKDILYKIKSLVLYNIKGLHYGLITKKTSLCIESLICELKKFMEVLKNLELTTICKEFLIGSKGNFLKGSNNEYFVIKRKNKKNTADIKLYDFIQKETTRIFNNKIFRQILNYK